MKKIKILDWTIKDPLNCIGYCAGICWNSNVSVNQKNVKRAIQCILDGHGRVEELPDIYITIEGFSAKCLRELYTHIGGSPTRLQASTRYINYSEGFNVITPHSVSKNPEALKIWDDTISHIGKSMKELKKLSIPNEDLTNLLPLAYESKMVWKINLRALINFFNMRLCNRAYWEIRELSILLREELSNYSEEWNTLSELFVPRCKALGYCVEKHSCGLKPSKSAVLGTLNNKGE